MKTIKVCPKCDHHFKMTASERVDCLFDEGTFESIDNHLKTENPLNFPAYTEKIESDAEKTGLNEAVLQVQVKSMDGKLLLPLWMLIFGWAQWDRLSVKKSHVQLKKRQSLTFLSSFSQQVVVHECRKACYL